MRRRKNKKFLLILGLLAVLAVGSTLSYFYASDTIDNKFRTTEAKAYISEKFDPNDRWVPGEEKQKEVRFGNDGEIAAVLRAKFTPVLKLKDGTEDPEAAGDFQLNFSTDFQKDWVKDGDWYYYKKVLSPSQMTDITLKSVTVSDQTGNDEHGIRTDYSGASYEVKVEGELLQASLAAESATYMKWKMIPTVTGETVAWKKD